MGVGRMLKGITVLDFSHYLPGPFASLRLADLGATVIKVEPLFGDLARSFDKESTALYTANNRNKQSIAINVKDAEGAEIALSLMEKADVIVESFRPHTMSRLGLGYEDAKKRNENIIYASITGYGQRHDHSHLAGHDLNFMAVSGVLAQIKSNGKPFIPSITLGDEIGGMLVSESILAALYDRERTNQGCYLDLSLTDSLTMLMNNHVMLYDLYSKNNGLDMLAGTEVSYCLYETADERYVAIGAVEQKFWERFCRYAGREDWISKQHAKVIEGENVYEEIKLFFLGKSFAYWEQVSLEIDCCLTPVYEANELAVSPYTKHMITMPYVRTHNMLKIKNPPVLGEQTSELLSKLGYDENKITLLRKKGIIAGLIPC